MNIYNLFKNTINRFSKDVNKIQTHIDNQVNDIMDYIVEENRTTSWSYRKWASGIAECWLTNYSLGNIGTMTTYTSGSSTQGASYYKHFQDLTFPITFIEKPHIQLTFGAATGLYMANMQPTNLTTTKFNFFIGSPKATETAELVINVYVRGFWKTYTYPASPAPIIQPIDPPTGAGDWVISSGQSGIWTYRKWNSGIAECWADTTVTVTSWTLWGNQYQGNFSPQYFEYPSEFFVSTPQLLVSCYPPATGGFGTSGVELWTDANHNHTKDATPYIYPLRPQTASAPTGNAPVIISMQAKSRWK